MIPLMSTSVQHRVVDGRVAETKEAGTYTKNEEFGKDDLLALSVVDSCESRPSSAFHLVGKFEDRGLGKLASNDASPVGSMDTNVASKDIRIDSIIDMLREVEKEKVRLTEKVKTLESQLKDAMRYKDDSTKNEKLNALLEAERSERFKEETKVKSYVKVLEELQQALDWCFNTNVRYAEVSMY